MLCCFPTVVSLHHFECDLIFILNFSTKFPPFLSNESPDERPSAAGQRAPAESCGVYNDQIARQRWDTGRQQMSQVQKPSFRSQGCSKKFWTFDKPRTQMWPTCCACFLCANNTTLYSHATSHEACKLQCPLLRWGQTP